MYYILTMKRILWLSASFTLIFASCVSSPESVDNPVDIEDIVPVEAEFEPEEPPAPIPDEQIDEEEAFDPSTIPVEVFNSTKIEVQQLIEKLNLIIRSRDYEGWVSFLLKEYREKLSSEEYLKTISASPVLVKQRITLRTLEDYFIHVVVPSRANDRVDDIEFIGQNKVKAFTLSAKGVRLRLYELEKNGEGWKIAN